MKKVFIVGQHGNEKLPIRAADTLINQIEVIVANPKAVSAGVRYLETDLNRSFPGDNLGKYEERLAAELKNRLEEFGEVVDFHTATCGTPLFAIVTKLTKNHLDLVRKLGVKKVVYMENSIASGKSLIDHVKVGVSIEAGREKTGSVLRRIEKVMRHYLAGKMLPMQSLEIYSVFEIMKRSEENNKLPIGARNFKKISINGQECYPVLARETSYPQVLSLLARRINLDCIILEGEQI